MKRTVLAFLGATAVAGSLLAANDQVVVPQKISKSDLGGKIFERPDMNERTHGDGHTTQDVTTLVSSDKKFSSGMYKSSKVRFEITEPYGVDEFMYFLEGSVTLTSSDGAKLVVNAGEAVTIPKEWTGVWETDGYTKIWDIYEGGSEPSSP